MRMMILAAVAATFGVVTMAQTARAADEFWIVQDTSTKKCTIVDKKPTVTTMTVVSPSGTVYKTKAEAQAELLRPQALPPAGSSSASWPRCPVSPMVQIANATIFCLFPRPNSARAPCPGVGQPPEGQRLS